MLILFGGEVIVTSKGQKQENIICAQCGIVNTQIVLNSFLDKAASVCF